MSVLNNLTILLLQGICTYLCTHNTYELNKFVIYHKISNYVVMGILPLSAFINVFLLIHF